MYCDLCEINVPFLHDLQSDEHVKSKGIIAPSVKIIEVHMHLRMCCKNRWSTLNNLNSNHSTQRHYKTPDKYFLLHQEI